MLKTFLLLGLIFVLVVNTRTENTWSSFDLVSIWQCPNPKNHFQLNKSFGPGIVPSSFSAENLHTSSIFFGEFNDAICF